MGLFLAQDALLKVAPHLKLDVIYDQSKGSDTYVILCSDQAQSHVFYGNRLTTQLLDYLTDAREVSEVLAHFKAQADTATIKQQLKLLQASRVLIDAAYEMDDSLASFWLDHTVTPTHAELKLKRHGFTIHNLLDKTETETETGTGTGTEPKNGAGADDQVGAAAQMSAEAQAALRTAMGQVGLCLDDPTAPHQTHLVLVYDYLQPELARLSADFRAQGAHWLPVNLSGNTPLIGPVFNKAEAEPCYNCLTKRMKELRQLRSTIGRYVENGELQSSGFNNAAAIGSVAYQFALQIARYVVADPSLFQEIHRLNWLTGARDTHFVSKVPQCHTCGQPLSNDRPLPPFRFDAGGECVKTSGGYKSTTPEKTLSKYLPLVSDVSGVVEYLRRVSDPDDDWSHVYKSGNNIALKSDNIFLSFSSVRMHNAGKGSSDQQAKVSALCESIERYSCAFQGDEIITQRRYVDFAPGEAILPNDFMHYSDVQYETGNQDTLGSNPFNFIPQPIDINASYQWSPIWSVFEDRAVWVPTQLLYFGYPYQGTCIARPDTNGVAAGSSRTEAFVQAYMETIERDNIAIWWFNRLQYPQVDMAGFSAYAQQAVTVYRQRYGRTLYAIDIRNDIDIPTFVVISHNDAPDQEQEVCFSAASHFDAEVAMTRAICEHNQLLNLIQTNRMPSGYRELSHDFAYWLRHAHVGHEDFAFLVPSAEPMKTRADYETYDPKTLDAQKQQCLDMAKQRGWSVYVADFTRADIGLPVVRVLIPQLRTMHKRLGPGRLYDVPVQMGKRSAPLAEADLNPMEIFI